jgi:hypothetical protein
MRHNHNENIAVDLEQKSTGGRYDSETIKPQRNLFKEIKP